MVANINSRTYKKDNCKNVKVSILVPIYNQEMYLRECLNSLVEQDCGHYEVILIDDGSTDYSAQICQEYVRKYHYFQYIYQDNMGLGKARNTGLCYASGTYIFFLDSDDMIQKNSIRKLLLFAEQNKADIVYFDEIICSETLEVLSVKQTYSEMDTRILKLNALELSMNPAHVCARLYHRDLFNDICFKNIWYEDMEIFPRLIMKANSLYYYKIPIYYYRQHKKTITHQKWDKRNLDVIKAWDSVYTYTAYTDEERIAIEIAIKKSICTFIFSHPQFANVYLEFYNHMLKKEDKIKEKIKQMVNINVKTMPLWQQADFYGYTYILKILAALQNIYQHGGVLLFPVENEECLQKVFVNKEIITLFIENDNVLLQEMRLKKRNHIVIEVLEELSKWNLVSLKNQIKEFPIVEKIVEKAILNSVKIEIDSNK